MHQLDKAPVGAAHKDSYAEEEAEPRAPQARQAGEERLSWRRRVDKAMRVEDERQEGRFTRNVEELVGLDEIVRDEEHDRVRRDRYEGECSWHVDHVGEMGGDEWLDDGKE